MLIIGDIHNKIGELRRLINSTSEEVIQVGDMGIESCAQTYNLPDRFRFLGGNHDDYYKYGEHPRALGDFGAIAHKGNFSLFFCRGAYSIPVRAKIIPGTDKRVIPVRFAEQEQIREEQVDDCLSLYSALKPDVVLSHDCPQEIAQYCWSYKDQNRTNMLLQRMLEIHKPTTWIFGHYHSSTNFNLYGVNWRCLGICKTLVI